MAEQCSKQRSKRKARTRHEQAIELIRNFKPQVPKPLNQHSICLKLHAKDANLIIEIKADEHGNNPKLLVTEINMKIIET